MSAGPSAASGSEHSRMAAGEARAEAGMASSRPAVKEPQKTETAVAAAPAPPSSPRACVKSQVPKQFSACAR